MCRPDHRELMKQSQTEFAAFNGNKDGRTHQEFPLASRSAIPEAIMTTRSKTIGIILSASLLAFLGSDRLEAAGRG
ncbi:MAG TPA: hypothetical protein VKA15_02290, partial [Isosphaeraceae bacterium]|nr:hypothetical protein [Isosphaeraceae bacterium]